jgi:ammonia channel protein AmtB
MNNLSSSALALTAPTVPALAFALYQLQFAAITPALIVFLYIPIILFFKSISLDL